MKTSTIQKTLINIASAGVALVATTAVATSYFPILAITVSYVAVAILVGVAAVDYRSGPKSYLTQ